MKDVIYKWNNRHLCPMKKECLPLLKQWRNEQMDILRNQRPLTDRDQQKWFRKIKNDSSQVIFLLMSPSTQGAMKCIGSCAITHIDFINHRGEISFLVDTSRIDEKTLYREDLLSTLYMLCWYGFERVGLHRIFTETFAFRKFHIKILEEFGLRLEGRLRKHQLVREKYCDSLIHSILHDEWAHVKKRTEGVLAE